MEGMASLTIILSCIACDNDEAVIQKIEENPIYGEWRLFEAKIIVKIILVGLSGTINISLLLWKMEFF